MRLPLIEGPLAARFLYGLHGAWRTLWPVDSGRHSVRHLIRRAARVGLFPRVWAKVSHGWMFLDPLDHVQGSILIHGEWEPETEAIIRKQLHPGDCFVDIGANAGYFSLLAASIVGIAGRVLAFEPNPETLRLLRANVQRSGYRNIEICAACCCDSPRRVTLFPNCSGNLGACSLSGTGQGVIVDGVCADSEIRKLPKPPSLIKIDIEGAEVLALRGMREALSARPTVILEVDERLLSRMGFTVSDVRNELSGFSLSLMGTIGVASPSATSITVD